MVPIVSFVGKHNSGKTTFLAKVIKTLVKKNINIAVIKHARSELDIDTSHDSGKLFQAGAGIVYAISADTTLVYKRHSKPVELDDICSRVAPDTDLIITEGYKMEPHPKVEVLRQAISKETMDLDNVIALVTDFKMDNDVSLPVFGFDLHEELSEFIITFFNLQAS